mmetsp:Transcript_27077/g.59420  ORF Transcript_27077/g.59420 Transcript_27077/m.59420 type:complete len:439 (+) Transcript_27077:73-1389(+)
MELTFVGDDVRSSDEELLGESTGRAPGPSLSKGVLVGLAVGVLLGSLGLFADWHDARQIAGKSKKSVTLHQFFEHHAVLDTVTQNRMLMRQQGDLGEGWAQERAKVAHDFPQFAHRLAAHNPAAADFLKRELSPEHVQALMTAMRFIMDPRVQRIGLEVARAIRDSASTDPEFLETKITQRLVPRMEEIQKLYKEMFHNLTVSGDDPWASVVHPSRVKLLKTFGEGWTEKLDNLEATRQRRLVVLPPDSAPESPGTPETLWPPASESQPSESPETETETATGDLSATSTGKSSWSLKKLDWSHFFELLDEAEQMVNVGKLFLTTYKAADKSAKVPTLLSIMMDASDTLFELASCELQVMEHFVSGSMHALSMASGAMSVANCVTTLGVEGTSAIGAVMHTMGVDGTRYGFAPASPEDLSTRRRRRSQRNSDSFRGGFS